MSTTRTTSTTRTRPTRRRSASRSPEAALAAETLLLAASLGGDAARADLAGDTEAAARAYAAWRRLRRRSGRQSRQLLRVAFDTGYGRAMAPAVPR